MISRSIIIFMVLTSFMFADGYKTITRAKYNELVQEPKVALVIGNKNYEQDSLTYPIVDATKIKKFLEGRGFKVIYALDVKTKGKLRALINQFIGSIQKDGVGLFYFSGHGMSAYHQNYLIPTKNSSIADDADIEDIGLSVGYLLRKLEKKGNRLNIVMLDACRNTLGKGSSSALGGDSAEGVFIAYATAEGKRAKDNGLFASSFVENAKIRGLTVEEVFKRVRKRIKYATGQTPFTNSGIVGDFYFSLPPIKEPKPEPIVKVVKEIVYVERPKEIKKEQPKEIRASYEPQMVHISRGSYIMGSNNGGYDEKPPHRVNIDYDFEIGKYEVTIAEYRACVDDGGCKQPERGSYYKKMCLKDNCPAIGVSWKGGRAYREWLSQKTGKNYRLPTEAEWEYVARAGTQSKWSLGDNENNLKKYAWYDENSNSKTHQVGTKKANQWGVYDMHGNVWEWCEDWYLNNYNSTSKNGSANQSQKDNYRVLRGGSWSNVASNTRSALRDWYSPTYRFNDVGFRLQRTLP